ncbi:MAG: 50S ribosomal protein L2 [candidate division Zixibacteria bacterium]|nr:50S ribosomal protein L2 [candidate division Zixibacteria bacterium]
MPLKSFRPTTPGLRWRTVADYSELTRSEPEKSLTTGMRKTGGRNNLGNLTCRHHGGGHKRLYRIIDFKREKLNVPATVASIEYDPNRSARIALLHYADGDKRYILAPDGLSVGNVILAGPDADIKPGNALPLERIPLGTLIHNVEMKRGRGGQIAKSAGSYAQLAAREGAHGHLKLPSGEIRLIRLECYATIGQVGNLEHENISYGKAGVSRWLGIRPRVRGVAKNPVDHPMGGGEGKASGGHPRSPWGQYAKGLKTRSTKLSDKLILSRRKK